MVPEGTLVLFGVVVMLMHVIELSMALTEEEKPFAWSKGTGIAKDGQGIIYRTFVIMVVIFLSIVDRE
tara:strand:- start:192 stop:395 length:204 start_codon:yes stop_codon:yes gene_type:complete